MCACLCRTPHFSPPLVFLISSSQMPTDAPEDRLTEQEAAAKVGDLPQHPPLCVCVGGGGSVCRGWVYEERSKKVGRVCVWRGEGCSCLIMNCWASGTLIKQLQETPEKMPFAF